MRVLLNQNQQLLSYDQYKNIFYWLYVVEYANFNSQEAYNPTLTDEGYHQGGMGAGITNMQDHYYYNRYSPLTPCGYGNTLGNGTGLVPLTIPEFTYFEHMEYTVEAQTMQMPRWRGFDNPFGDSWTILDGILIDVNTYDHPNHMNYVYTCQDANKYSSILNDAYVKVGEEIPQSGYTRAFDLGSAAHIIPHVMGGNTTEYICDYHEVTKTDTTYMISPSVGGTSDNGARAGLGSFNVGEDDQCICFRTVSNLVSFPSDKIIEEKAE